MSEHAQSDAKPLPPPSDPPVVEGPVPPAPTAERAGDAQDVSTAELSRVEAPPSELFTEDPPAGTLLSDDEDGEEDEDLEPSSEGGDAPGEAGGPVARARRRK